MKPWRTGKQRSTIKADKNANTETVTRKKTGTRMVTKEKSRRLTSVEDNDGDEDEYIENDKVQDDGKIQTAALSNNINEDKDVENEERNKRDDVEDNDDEENNETKEVKEED